MSFRVRVDGAPDGLEVLHGHPQHGQFVQLPRHGVAHGHHGRELGDVRVHFVAPPLFDFTVILPGESKRKYNNNKSHVSKFV